MGAGKSAVGRQLARMLHLNFMDSDDEIESRTGVDIPFIFEKEGEEGFRKREALVNTGYFFKSTQRTNNKAELLIFVTPRILDDGASIY